MGSAVSDAALEVPASLDAPRVVERFTYRPDIDGLRAVAILPVLVYHAFPSLLRGGFLGVDVFFVISGFLIASLIFDELARGQFSVARFYARRIRRIMPALGVVLATCLVIGYRGLFDSEFLQLARHALAGALGMANLSLYQDTGYFSLPAETNPMLHLWSLGVEEQFYLLLPATLLLTRRKAAWILVPALVASLAACAAPMFTENARFYLPQFRIWELLAGVLLAQATSRGWRVPDRLRDPLSIGGTVLLCVGFVAFSNKTPAALAEGVAVLGSLAVIAAGARAGVNRFVLSSRVAVGIGKISYSLYLWHWPLLALSKVVRPGHGTGTTLAVLALSAVLACLSYLFVETPARQRKVPAWALAGVMACIAAVSWQVVHVDGRLGWAKEAGTMYALGENDPGCWKKFWNLDDREVIVHCSNPAAAPTVALIGDSHAHHLFDGVRDYYAARGQNVLSLSASGCTPIAEPPEKEICAATWPRILAKLEELGTIKTVIVSEYITYMEQNTRPHWVQNARTLFGRLAAHNDKVVLVLDVPPMPVNPRIACQARPLPFAASAEDLASYCSTPRKAYEARVPAYRALAAQAVAGIPNTRIFDLPDRMCSKTTCPAIVDGHVIYLDDNHLNEYGSRYVAKFFDWESGPAQPQSAAPKSAPGVAAR
jgi:peptidoglycan/LPS O-acetylase OafA/YrhL